MKIRPAPFLVTFVVFLAWQTAAPAAALREASVTRVVNDVKIVPQQQQPVPAKVGDLVRGPSAVSTGAQSRAELRFQDNTLTRLGANSIFTLDEATRTVDLQQGAILMQVPKKVGGLPTKIRTAAVTAAITGTTLMMEYQPNGYVKVIVLEGEVDVFLTEDPSSFRTIRPGDMIILQTNAKDIPEPVQVDLKRLKETSKLTNEQNFQALGNERHLQRAELQQQNLRERGELHNTRLVIHGEGTNLMLDGEHGIRDRIGDQPPGGGQQGGPNQGPNGPGGPGGQGGPGPDGQVTVGRAPILGGQAVIDGDSTFRGAGVTSDRVVASNTIKPTVTATFGGETGTGRGGLYNPKIHGPVSTAYFNQGGSAHETVDKPLKDAGTWTEFRFNEVQVVDQPNIATSTGKIKNLLLSSQTVLTMGEADSSPTYYVAPDVVWDLDDDSLKGLALLGQEEINWHNNMKVAGTDQRVLLYTESPTAGPIAGVPTTTPSTTGDIKLDAGANDSLIDVPEGLVAIYAGNNLDIVGTEAATGATPTIRGADVQLEANGNITVTKATIAAKTNLSLSAGDTLRITDSSVLKQIAATDPLDISLEAKTGNLEITGTVSAAVDITGNNIKAISQAGNLTLNYSKLTASNYLTAVTYGVSGQLLIGNSTLSATQGMKLYAEGSNGMVRFVGDSTLNGPATIAGKTVQVDTGVNVNVTSPGQLRVHADTHNYNDTTHGNFTSGGTPVTFTSGTNQNNFSSRPGL